jgi:uncharacterized protein
MGKYLLLVAGVLVVYWIVRASMRSRQKKQSSQAPGTEKMVRCADCGIYVPRGEGLLVRGNFYCCAEHQQRHDPDK